MAALIYFAPSYLNPIIALCHPGDPSGKSPVRREAGVRPVKPHAQKYFCFSEVQITPI
jgi:hypothetical protein